MKKEKRVWAITLIALGSLAPVLTNAQQDSIKSINLNEVVITATKFPKSASETGKVLTVIDETVLERSAGKDLSQLLNEQVGLVINGANSNPGKDKGVYLRGAKSEYTLFLLDGVPLNDASGPGGAFDPRLLSLDQLERIEILKGSQSTLYGSDAIAGVINLITKKSNQERVAGNVSISYGSYDQLKTTANVSGSMDWLNYNIGASHLEATGISEAEDINSAGGFDRDGYKQNAFNAGLGINATPNLTVSPFFRYNEFDGDFDGGSFADDNSTYKSKLINPGVRSQWKLKNGAVNFLYGHNRTDREYDGPFGPSTFRGRFDNADLFFNHDLTRQLQLLGGVNYQHLKLVDATLPVANPDADLVSPYLSLFVRSSQSFTMELGGRYNNHSKYGSNATYSFNPSYTFNKKIKVFINQSAGFKAPTLSQLYGAFGANENLKPEKSMSTEAGIQAYVNTKTDVRLTVFKRKVDDAIIFTFANGNMNLDEQNDYGFEAEASTTVGEKLSLRAYYAFVDGEITTRGNGSDSTFYNLFRRPKHTIGLNAGIQMTEKLYGSVNIKTFSSRKDLFFNPANFFNAEIVELDSYALLDFYAEYKMLDGKLRIFVDAKNLLNENYREVYGYNTLGFNLNTGLSYKF